MVTVTPCNLLAKCPVGAPLSQRLRLPGFEYNGRFNPLHQFARFRLIVREACELGVVVEVPGVRISSNDILKTFLHARPCRKRFSEQFVLILRLRREPVDSGVHTAPLLFRGSSHSFLCERLNLLRSPMPLWQKVFKRHEIGLIETRFSIESLV